MPPYSNINKKQCVAFEKSNSRPNQRFMCLWNDEKIVSRFIYTEVLQIIC